MSNNKSWQLEIGFYSGIVFGVRTYEEETQTAHVFYLPFVDLALITYK
tara:strand:- start:429 stop:572 length:144 start_codon:yes stop_codon:yes gene_type:complete